jgi:Protein of unknown function (DUF3574)
MMRPSMGAAALLLLAACTSPPQTAASACAAPLKPAVQIDLYFGLATKDREIGEVEWAAFLNEEVTPRFPDGLSVVNVAGQYRLPTGYISRERSKMLIVIVLDPPGHLPKIQAIVDAYKRRFNQLSVLHVERAICAAF